MLLLYRRRRRRRRTNSCWLAGKGFEGELRAKGLEEGASGAIMQKQAG
jgi:hypothetical protein